MDDGELPPAASTHSESGRMRIASWVKIGVPALVLAGVAVGVLLGTGNRTDGVPGHNPTPSTSPNETVNSTPDVTVEPTPSPSEFIINGVDFSPEALSQLTAEQLTRQFEITTEEAPTPEAYVQIVVQKEEAFRNAGMDEADWGPYRGAGIDVYSSAMLAKYLEPISQGLFGHDGSGIQNFYVGGWERYDIMSGLGRNYSNNVELIAGSISTTEHPDGSFDVTFRTTEGDNYYVADVFGEDPNNEPFSRNGTVTFNDVHPNADGVLLPASISEIFE